MNNPSVPDYANSSILVVGDIILDQYIYGTCSRISPEAPVPVFLYQKEEYKPGGSANVAVNISSLGARAILVGTCGDDHHFQILSHLLERKRVISYLHNSPFAKTTTKTRLVSQQQQLIRIDSESRLPKESLCGTYDTYQKLCPDVDAIILSDYNKGALDQCQNYIAYAASLGLPVLIDPKGSDFAKYSHCYLIKPNLYELEAIIGKCDSEHDMIERSGNLIDALNINAMLVTRSSSGMTLIQRKHKPIHFTAIAKDVFDVTGAGDTVISYLAASLAAGSSLENSVALANHAAGIVVGRFGTSFATPTELMNSLSNSHTHTTSKIYTSVELLKHALESLKEQGKTIVMTNGCFDIIHSGHVSYLERARALGDHLVVAVNSDSSVSNLKGSGRPINTLQDRMKVLASLSCIDSIISFPDLTPQILYETLAPNILVKGSDYIDKEVAGSSEVKALGGRIEFIPYVEGFSTTSTITRILSRE